jgi:putative SOS response-associated peptidase YedK
MCGRVRLSSDYSEIKIKLKFDLASPAPNFERDWNLPPTRPMLVIWALAAGLSYTNH